MTTSCLRSPRDSPRKLMAVLQYPVIILALLSLAYMFFTPAVNMNMDNRRLVAKYACTHKSPPDWCNELAADLAEGRRTRNQADLLARTKTLTIKLSKETP